MEVAEVWQASEGVGHFGLAILNIRFIVTDRQSVVLLGRLLLIRVLALLLGSLCLHLRRPLLEG